MAEYVSNPVTMREIPGVGAIEQNGQYATVAGAGGKSIIVASDVLANRDHFFRETYPEAFRMMETGEAAAFVLAKVHGKRAQIRLTREHWARGAAERARYAAWMNGAVACETDRKVAEHAYDARMNEGGEGYNPHRTGTRHTYAPARRQDRDYPDNA